jgi:hypothetical protein
VQPLGPWPSFRRPRLAVYTCLFGGYERFNDFDYRDGSEDIDFLCFTDDPQLRPKHWRTVLMRPNLLDHSRASRMPKTQPHRFLPHHDWSLYVDNSLRLKVPPRRIFDYLAEAPSPYVCFRHYERNCVYDEAAEVLRLGRDGPARVNAQMDAYRRLGYPPNNGLAKNAFILRRHHDPHLPEVMEAWFNQILLWSRRDQLSLNPVMWSYGFHPSYLPLQFSDYELLEWPYSGNVRLPYDFEDARYLQIHPEVTRDPRRHYLYEGVVNRLDYK